jgi:hypothetical protein
MKPLATVLLMATLAACVAPATRPVRADPSRLPPVPTINRVGLERVLGQNARSLIALFGRADADLIEGPARKLQFGSGICVLDAYLYPPAGGRGEPVVTHIDTRQRDGSAIDRASCVAALSRRGGGGK